MIYLDHAATTYVYKEAAEEAYDLMVNRYGNPSSMHRFGMEAEKVLTESKKVISDILKVQKEEIYLTSGGTESSNLAILGIAHAYHRSGKHILTTSIEHSATLESYKVLKEEGYDFEEIPVDSKGFVKIDALKEMVNSETILVSVIHVNNELGTIQDLALIGRTIKEINPETKLHVDGVQGFCKIPVKLNEWKVDAYSFSGHKIHGPKGIGGLYLKKGVLIKPIIHGGHQQLDVRSGTENVPGAGALCIAAKKTWEDSKFFREHTKILKDAMIKRLLVIEDIVINSQEDNFAPHILNVSFGGVRGEVLLHALEDKEIYVSTGSACASNKTKVSRVLKSIGHLGEYLEGGVRFSFDTTNTLEEINETADALIQLVPLLRKFKRK